MATTKKKIVNEAEYVIPNYAQTIVEIETLWRDVRMSDMVNRALKESADSQFATILSNGILVRPSWIADMRLGRPREHARAHAVFTATNKLIMLLNSEIANSSNSKRAQMPLLVDLVVASQPI